MEIYEEKKEALKRLTSKGSKLVVLAASMAVSSALVSWQLQTGRNPGMIDIPGLISLPGWLAVYALAIVSGATGWTAWVYLRQGQRQLYTLEFKDKFDPDHIKAFLAGSSLVSTSVLLLRALCVLALVSFIIKLPKFGVIQLITGLFQEIGYGFTYLGLLVIAPFLLITLMMPRLRYLNPSTWEMGSWLIWLLMKVVPQNFSFQRPDWVDMEQLPEEAESFDPAAFYEDVERLLPEMQAKAINTLLRRFGRGIYFRLGQLDDLSFEEMTHVGVREADRILRRQLPHASTETRTVLRQRLIGF